MTNLRQVATADLNPLKRVPAPAVVRVRAVEQQLALKSKRERLK